MRVLPTRRHGSNQARSVSDARGRIAVACGSNAEASRPTDPKVEPSIGPEVRGGCRPKYRIRLVARTVSLGLRRMNGRRTPSAALLKHLPESGEVERPGPSGQVRLPTDLPQNDGVRLFSETGYTWRARPY